MRIGNDFRTFVSIKGAWTLIATLFLYGVGTGILAPMNAVYLDESIGLSKEQIVIVFASSLFLNMTITIVTGWFSDRLKSKKQLPIIAASLCIIGLLLYMNATDFASALVGMIIAVAPSGLIMGQLFAMSRNHFSHYAKDIVEMAQLWLRATFSVGFFTGLLLGANIFLIATFRGVLWGNLAGYVCLLLLLLFYRETTAAPGTKQEVKGEPFSLIMLIALLMLACADAIRGLYLQLVVLKLFEQPQIMSYLWSAQAVFELLFMTVTGYWAARYGSKKIIFLGGFFALATYLTYAAGASLPVFFAVQPLYSFFVSILYGVAMGYVQRMFIARTGFGSSLYVFISQMASLIGYFLPLFVQGITPHIFFIPSALVACSLILMATVLLSDKRAPALKASA
ncbi:MFS transporter [Paenibacillus thermotolerans]|uniref:MFS transporter n=1 Tax=Paenibacillus thermotolerans TaxID=3027807 RepID=UPI002367FC9C|nr:MULTISPECIES: MFS transporter [unclassified Paenibacillus]